MDELDVRRSRRLGLILLGLSGIGAAVTLAADENLRRKLLGERAFSALSGDELVTSGQPGPWLGRGNGT